MLCFTKLSSYRIKHIYYLAILFILGGDKLEKFHTDDNVEDCQVSQYCRYDHQGEDRVPEMDQNWWHHVLFFRGWTDDRCCQ